MVCNKNMLRLKNMLLFNVFNAQRKIILFFTRFKGGFLMLSQFCINNMNLTPLMKYTHFLLGIEEKLLISSKVSKLNPPLKPNVFIFL